MPKLRFVQMSDTHVLLDPIAEAHGVRPGETLRRVLARLRDLEPAPDFAIFTGDLVGDDDLRSYQTFRELIETLPMMCYYAVGNHDLREGIRRTLLDGSPDGANRSPDSPLFYAFERQGLRFLVLDSQIPGDVPGAIDPAQMDWIDQTIRADTDLPTFVFVHHPPLEIGVPWLDPHHIANGRDLLRTLSRGNVRHVFYGHVHMVSHCEASGVSCSSVPSTCYQFGERGGGFELTDSPPGLRVVDVDGHATSSRILYAPASQP